MIREITNSDIEQVRELWRMSFGNADGFRFLCKLYPNPYILVNERKRVSESGKTISQIISFLCLLPLNFVENKTEHKCWLVYRCATADDYCRKGVMSQMLQFAERKMEDYSVEGIIAVPQTDMLWNLFKRNGYCLFSKKRNVIFEGYDTDNLLLRLNEINGRQLNTFRRKQYSNTLEWDKNYSNLFVAQANNRGRQIYSFSLHNVAVVIVCYKQRDVLVVEEITTRVLRSGKLSSVNLQEAANVLCAYFGTRCVSFYIPENSDYAGNMLNASLIRSKTLGYDMNNYIYAL